MVGIPEVDTEVSTQEGGIPGIVVHLDVHETDAPVGVVTGNRRPEPQGELVLCAGVEEEAVALAEAEAQFEVETEAELHAADAFELEEARQPEVEGERDFAQCDVLMENQVEPDLVGGRLHVDVLQVHIAISVAVSEP